MPVQVLSINACVEKIKSDLKLNDDHLDLNQLKNLLQQTEKLIINFNGIGRGHFAGVLASSVAALLPITTPWAAAVTVGVSYFLGDYVGKYYLQPDINDLPEKKYFQEFLGKLVEIANNHGINECIDCVQNLKTNLNKAVDRMSFNKELYGTLATIFSQKFCIECSISIVPTLISNGTFSTAAVNGARIGQSIDANLENQMQTATTPYLPA